MKEYIQTKPNGIFYNHICFAAYKGFYEMGFEIIPFSEPKELAGGTMNMTVVALHARARTERLSKSRFFQKLTNMI